MSDELRGRLLAEMESLRTVDCHSHTTLKRDYNERGGLDLFSMMSYFQREIAMIADQQGADLYEGCATDADKWERLKPILARTRNESYWRHNMVTYQALFDLTDDNLDDGNWEALNDCIKKRTADPDWYHHVTDDIAKLETQILNVPWFLDWEPEYFTCTLRMEEALEVSNEPARQRLEEHTECAIDDLKTLKAALVALIEGYRARGSVGIKLAHAYRRTLQSDDVSETDAELIFGRALKGEELPWPERKALEDHIIHFLAAVAGDLDQVFQIHTGVQGNWCVIPDSDPMHLLPLLHAHRNTKFDLFHAGYPYSRELGMIAKHCGNVWLNMAWMYVITMEGSRQTLSEWIDLVPGDRLLGFGSDVGYPEMVYGHLVMARSCLADVLATKVERDFLGETTAFSLVHQMLRDNAMTLYGLEAK